LFVIVGLVVTMAISGLKGPLFLGRKGTTGGPHVRSGHPDAVASILRETAHKGASHRRAIVLIALAIVFDIFFIERLGFVIASIPLFWMTARAFDPTHPVRDAIAATALSTGAYLLFARLLQISLPAGVLAPWV
jgi:hypothetical protein